MMIPMDHHHHDIHVDNLNQDHCHTDTHRTGLWVMLITIDDNYNQMIIIVLTGDYK